MAIYLEKAKEQLSLFFAASIEVIPRSKNSNTDALAKLASTRDIDLLDAVFVEYLADPIIHPQSGIMELTQGPSWMDPIVMYLKTGEQPVDKIEARVIRLKVALVEGLFHATPKMCNPLRNKIHHEGNSQRHMWEPCWGAISSVQSLKTRLLLANHEGRLHGVCP